MFVLFISCLSLIAGVSAASFDWDTGTTALWHAESTYCSPETYLSRTYKGELKGFVAVYSVNDTAHDTQGYVGYNTNEKVIYVAYRGSSSIQNWISNLDAVTTSYPACNDCKVHKGFYVAEQNSIHGVINEVKKLKAQFPSYSVVITGHSLGGALATLASADIQAAGLGPVRVFTFGCPRVGNTAFAEWYSGAISDHSRVTHHKDMVPHSPMHERFTHVDGEWYEPDDSVPVGLNACSGYEDKDCSYQWHITSISDHLWYLNLHMGSGDSECASFL